MFDVICFIYYKCMILKAISFKSMIKRIKTVFTFDTLNKYEIFTLNETKHISKNKFLNSKDLVGKSLMFS